MLALPARTKDVGGIGLIAVSHRGETHWYARAKRRETEWKDTPDAALRDLFDPFVLGCYPYSWVYRNGTVVCPDCAYQDYLDAMGDENEYNRAAYRMPDGQVEGGDLEHDVLCDGCQKVIAQQTWCSEHHEICDDGICPVCDAA